MARMFIHYVFSLKTCHSIASPLMLFILSLYLSTPASGQSESTFFSNITTREGLPSKITTAIAQDAHDFIWIGTGRGLARYDGNQFRIFKKENNPHSLSSNEINTLLAQDQNVWVGTWNGLNKIDIESLEVTPIKACSSMAIRALLQTNDSTLWIGTSSGLLKFNTRDQSITTYTKENSQLSHNTIRALHHDSKGTLWVGTYDGLCKLDPNSANFQHVRLRTDTAQIPKNHLILDIKKAFENKIWVGTETGLYLYNTVHDKADKISADNFSNDVIKCIYQAANGDLWLGTDFGLNIFNPLTGKNKAHFHNPKLAYTIANNVVWQIFEDKSGLIWLVTSNGISKISNTGNFYEYKEVAIANGQQQIGNQVRALLHSQDGALWLGTQRGVLRQAADGTETLFDTRSKNTTLLLNNINALTEDQQHLIWIGTAGGINIWNPRTNKMTAITSTQKNGLTSNYIAGFVQTPTAMWVSAWEGGLYKVNGEIGQLQFQKVPEIGGSDKLAFANDRLWTIVADELYKVNPSTLSITKIPEFSSAIDGQMLFSLYADTKGRLWAGTHNGLLSYNTLTGKTQFFEIQSGNDLSPGSICEDKHGNIWTVSNHTMYRIHVKTKEVQAFPLAPNLPLRNFQDGCVAKLPQGQILLGGDNGYIICHPDRAVTPTFSPNVFITNLNVNNQSIIAQDSSHQLLQKDIAFTDAISLNYDQRSVSLEFSSLQYWQPQMNTYAYRLKGLDQNWSYASGQKNFAVYSSLPSGTYEFQVKATNNYHQAQAPSASLIITVKPPLYRSTGFILLYIVIVLVLIYYGLKFYSTRVRLRNELKMAILEKSHAEELEHTKEQFFTNISHELRTPISLILPPIHEVQRRGKLDNNSQQMIALAEKNAIRLLKLVNQILDFNKSENQPLQLKARKLNMVTFCQDIFELFRDQADRHQIDFYIHASAECIDVWADQEKIETVLFNLLSNAFKFTPENGHISLELIAENDHIKIIVSDTGIGISEEDKQHIFERFYQTNPGRNLGGSSGIGLTLAAEYIQLHQGKIEVESNQGEGTTFVVTLPLGDAHLSANQKHPETIANQNSTATNQTFTPEPQQLDRKKPLILVIDDNADILAFIRATLEEKFQLIFAADGKEGLQKASDFMPDLIISDIMMPEVDGLELCQQIKSNAQTSHIMIILLTAKSMNTSRLEGVQRGADVYLTKPFDTQLLEAHIRNLLSRKTELTNYFRTELTSYQGATDEKDNQDNQFLKKVMDIIEANISETEFTVDELSKEMGMSSTHLYRRLKALTDNSAKDIIRKYRLKKASLLLQNNEGNVSEVMRKVGFSSLSYFSKCFKQEYSMTPNDYKQHQNSDG